ncbi:serine/threonine-protein kinase [Nocardiopsis valliformis]|uniref:serine/threonine-protein kinase n=1 Tax=Nocardiopsis valliformis TaxID=239974 RepID=UPI00034DC85A|nr:serine/threonine-protein kinase [Nocardiopsis valliformis]
MSPTSAPVEVGGYRLLKEVGRGGFGSVHLGEDARGRRVAVKLLHVGPGTDPRFFDLFAREVEAARRVSPFCVAQVLDADPKAAQPWIVSEFVDGPTLSQDVRENGPRTGTDLDRLAVSTATALSAIHAAGVVHRDLKPGNIMLAADGPRVIDFGIARPFEEATSLTASAVIGTLQYMAPEQLEDGARLTPALDVYAWGAVMVYAATGRPVFDAGSQRALVKSVLVDTPDCSALPDRLRGIVERCLSKEPEERPSARELIDLLTGVSGAAAAVPAAAPPPVAQPAPAQASAPVRTAGGPPLWFDGSGFSDPDALAEAMRERWETAVAFLTQPRQCRILGSWLIDLHGQEQAGAQVAADARTDPELALVRLLARLRPDLPPLLRGRDMTLTALTGRVRAADSPFLEAGLTVEVVEALSGHHCAEPGHDCRGFPCQGYREFASDLGTALRSAERAAQRYNPWLGGLGWIGSGPVHPTSAGFIGQLVTALLAPQLWRGRMREATRVHGRWAGLAPAAKVSGDLAEAAGVEAVHLRVSLALVELSEQEARTSPQLEELRRYGRAKGFEALAVLGALGVGVVLILTQNPEQANEPGMVMLTLMAVPLALQQLISWSLRGWRRRRPPEWVVVEADGVQATVLRLTEQLEHAQAQLDLSYQNALGR